MSNDSVIGTIGMDKNKAGVNGARDLSVWMHILTSLIGASELKPGSPDFDAELAAKNILATAETVCKQATEYTAAVEKVEVARKLAETETAKRNMGIPQDLRN